MTELSKKVNIKEPIETEKLTFEKNDSFPKAYRIYFPLDSVPDSTWEQCFERETPIAEMNLGRRVSIIADNLVIIAPLDEVNKKMIEKIKKLVDDTNRCVDEQNKAEIEKEKIIQARKKREEEEIQKARDALKG